MWVARSINTFVMLKYIICYWPREINRFDDIISDLRMRFHDFVFNLSQLAWFTQDLGRDMDFTDIMDYCGNSASDNTEFTVILKVSKVIVKPERFCVTPGKFTVFAWFPDPFDITTISDAKADAAHLLWMNTCGVCLDQISDLCEEYMCDNCEDGCENDEGDYDDDDDDCDDD